MLRSDSIRSGARPGRKSRRHDLEKALEHRARMVSIASASTRRPRDVLVYSPEPSVAQPRSRALRWRFRTASCVCFRIRPRHSAGHRPPPRSRSLGALGDQWGMNRVESARAAGCRTGRRVLRRFAARSLHTSTDCGTARGLRLSDLELRRLSRSSSHHHPFGCNHPKRPAAAPRRPEAPWPRHHAVARSRRPAPRPRRIVRRGIAIFVRIMIPTSASGTARSWRCPE